MGGVLLRKGTSVAKRYLPHMPLAIGRKVFSPGYVHVDGVAGYPELPKLTKDQKSLFYEIEVPAPVEQATATPGETRKVGRPRKTKAASDE